MGVRYPLLSWGGGLASTSDVYREGILLLHNTGMFYIVSVLAASALTPQYQSVVR